MTDYLEFLGQIDPVEWGTSTYTILRLPPDVAEALTRAKARRVEGEINEHPVNLALTKAPPVDGLFLYTGKSLMDRINAKPGDLLEVRLRPADPDNVELPADVASALRAGGKSGQWSALSPGKRRGLLHQITSAKRPETREKRIATLMATL